MKLEKLIIWTFAKNIIRIWKEKKPQMNQLINYHFNQTDDYPELQDCNIIMVRHISMASIEVNKEWYTASKREK